jgi:hypothetical protein
MVDGFGAQFAFQIRDSAGVDNTLGGFSAVRDGADNSGKLTFQVVNAGVQNTASMVIDKNGNVGIGTIFPQTKLHVNGPISASSFGSGSLFGTASYANNSLSSSFPWRSNGSASICDQRIGVGANAPRNTNTSNFIYVSGNNTGLEINAPNLTNGGLFLIYTPLSTDIDTGKAFSFVAGNEAAARGVFYSDGAYGIGNGTSSRDVFFGRSSAGVISITSDKVSGAASLMVSNITASRITASAGLLGTASYARQSLSASYAPFVQTYQDNTISASWASSSLSSSYAITASYALNGGSSGATTEYIWVPAAGMIPQITTGPEATTREFASGSTSASLNISVDAWLFDGLAQEGVNVTTVMPNTWDTSSTLSAQFYWTTLTGSAGSTVEWAIRNQAFNDSNTLQVASMSTTSSVSDTLIISQSVHISDVITGISVGGSPQTSSFIQWNILRNVQTDTLNFDAALLGMKIGYTTI